MNKVILMGRLTADPVVTNTPSGVLMAKYSLAVRRQYARQGEKDTDFFDCVAFSKDAEFAQKWFFKGKLVAIEGRLQVNNYEDKNKIKRTAVDVIIEGQHFTGDNRNQADAAATQDSGSSTDYGTPNGMGNIEDDNDLPF